MPFGKYGEWRWSDKEMESMEAVFYVLPRLVGVKRVDKVPNKQGRKRRRKRRREKALKEGQRWRKCVYVHVSKSKFNQPNRFKAKYFFYKGRSVSNGT